MEINLTNNIGSLNPELDGKLKKTVKSFQNTDLNPHNTSVFENNAKDLFKFEDTRKKDLKSATAVSDDIIALSKPIETKSLKTRNSQYLTTESLPTPAQGTRKEVGNNPNSNNDMRSPLTINSQKLVMTEFNPLSTIDTYWRQYKQIINSGEKEIKLNELKSEKAEEHKDPAKPPAEKTKEQQPLQTGATLTTTEKVSAKRSYEKEEIDARIENAKLDDDKQAKFSEEVAKTYAKIEKEINFKKETAALESIEQESKAQENLNQETIKKDIDTSLSKYEETGKEIINKKIEEDIEIAKNTDQTNIDIRIQKAKQLDTEIKDDIKTNFEKLSESIVEEQNKTADARKERFIADDLQRFNEVEQTLVARDKEINDQISYNAKRDREIDQTIQTAANTLNQKKLSENQDMIKNETMEAYAATAERINKNTEENFKEIRTNLETIGSNIIKKEEEVSSDKAKLNRQHIDEEIRKSYEKQYERLDQNSTDDYKRLRAELEKAKEEKDDKEDQITKDLETRRESDQKQKEIRKEKRNEEDMERENRRRENQK